MQVGVRCDMSTHPLISALGTCMLYLHGSKWNILNGHRMQIIFRVTPLMTVHFSSPCTSNNHITCLYFAGSFHPEHFIQTHIICISLHSRVLIFLHLPYCHNRTSLPSSGLFLCIPTCPYKLFHCIFTVFLYCWRSKVYFLSKEMPWFS